MQADQVHKFPPWWLSNGQLWTLLMVETSGIGAHQNYLLKQTWIAILLYRYGPVSLLESSYLQHYLPDLCKVAQYVVNWAPEILLNIISILPAGALPVLISCLMLVPLELPRRSQQSPFSCLLALQVSEKVWKEIWSVPFVFNIIPTWSFLELTEPNQP